MFDHIAKTTETSLKIEKFYNWEWKARPERGDLTGFKQAISGIKPGEIISDLVKFHAFAWIETGEIGRSVICTSDIISVEMTESYYIIETETTPYKLFIASQGAKHLIGV